MRATAASAPSNTMFSVSCTLRFRARRQIEDVREHARPIAVAHDQHVRRRRPPREVDDVGHAAGLLERADDAHRFGGDRFLRLIGGRADVVRAVDAGQRRERASRSRRSRRPARSRRRRARRAGRARDHRFGERRVIDQLAARGVDRRSRRFAASTAATRLTMPRVVGPEREVHAQHVAARRDLLGRRRQRQRQARRRRRDPSASSSSRLGAPCSRPSKRRLHSTTGMPNAAARTITSRRDAAGAEHAERLAEQPARLRVLLLVPAAGAQLGDVVGNAAIEREDQRRTSARRRRRRSCRDSSTRRCRAARPPRRRSCCSRRRRARPARAGPRRASPRSPSSSGRRARRRRCRGSPSPSASSLRSGSKTTSQPGGLQAVEPLSSNLSATRTFMGINKRYGLTGLRAHGPVL